MDMIWTYYGIDWLAMVMTFLSLYFLGGKKRSGFVYGKLANLSGLAFGVMAQSVANPVANVVFMTLKIRGYRSWKQMKRK